MKKIALIEDRYVRQLGFLEQNKIELDAYEDVLSNFVEDDAQNLIEQIVHDTFDLQEYAIIICHKSVVYENKNTTILSNLRHYCKKHGKTLILFSGGISVNYYDTTEFELLELNSETFYSKNLVLFLQAVQNGAEDILMLSYGEHWKQNIVANVLEKTNLFIFDLQNGAEEPSSFRMDAKLKKTKYQFYEPKEKTIDEIIRFKESLEEYFNLQVATNNLNQSVIIHHDNVCDLRIFNNHIKFIQSSEDIDTYISDGIIIKELVSKEFDTIFIKDNLSSNYLELYGLRVAYHIRLSSELENKRFAPIVIISDFDEAALNRFTHEANILFTQGIYLCKNTKEDIQKYQSLELQGVTNYDEFLSSIEVAPPKDTSGTHGIANKWSIYRWAKFLGAEGEAIDKNKSEVENQLYFKYLKAKNPIVKKKGLSIVPKAPQSEGNILYIDDEWDKGWKDIFEKYFSKSQNINFHFVEHQYKDTSYESIENLVKEFLTSKSIDTVLLDMRLIKEDHEQKEAKELSGIKLLTFIKAFNPGIQVILLTASEKSTILDEANKYNILGYIKKENSSDDNTYTKEVFKKITNLIDLGFERKYLKDIWNIQKEILGLSFFEKDKHPEIKIEIESVFEILQTDMENKFIYAMFALFKTIEISIDLYIEERRENGRRFAYWKSNNTKINFVDRDEYFPKELPHNSQISNDATINKIRVLCYEKLQLNLKEMHDSLKIFVQTRNETIHIPRGKILLKPTKGNIEEWFKTIQTILSKLN
ncbi:hypothetical protein KKG72_07605 [bacterium]|nr:hypothetical protein [bacterium]MBU1994112.1 hypothetical protein [bacterium]